MKALLPSSCLIFLCLITAETAGQVLVTDYHAKVHGKPYHAIASDQQNNVLVYQYVDGLNAAYVGNLAKIDTDGKLSSSFQKVFTDGNILQVELQDDGKMLIRGDFTAVNGRPTPNLVRLHADGTLDSAFTSALLTIDQFKLQSNGKIVAVVLGQFSRLNTDGTLDETFSMPSFFTPSGPIQIGPDDHIYLPASSQVYKLKPDGGYDPDFYVGTGVNNSGIKCIEIQSDGKILVGGMFTSYNGTAANSLVRLMNNGQVDVTFSVGTGTTGQISRILQRANKNILIGGQFYEYENEPASLVELTADGNLDRIIAVVNYSITSVAETPDGRVTIGGDFTRVNGIKREYIAKFNADYTLDAFSPALHYNNPNGRSIEVRKDGSVVVGGTFDFEGIYDGPEIVRKKLIQLTPFGLFDNTFAPDLASNPYVYALLLQDDNKLLLSGPPDANNASLVRLSPQGIRDDSFEIGAGPTNVSPATGIAYRMKSRNDTIYLSGHFDRFNGVATQSLVGLTPNGGVVQTFSGLPQGTNLYEFDIQSDGKIIALGTFEVDGTPRRICRFNRNGTLDNSFAINDVQGNLNFITIDSLDRIYVAGDLYSINGALVNSLVRFLPNGNFDTSFNTGSGFKGTDDVRTLEILPDGSIAVGGYFSGYKNDRTVNGFVLLDQTGDIIVTPSVKFGKKSATLNMKYSNGALYLGGRFIKDDYSDVYGVVKILLDPIELPEDPGNLTVQLFEPGTFKLDWDDNSSNETAFVLYRSVADSSHFEPYDTVAANVTNTFDGEIVSDLRYFYTVKATNNAGESQFSNIVSAAWIPRPLPPTNLRVSSFEVGVLLIEWDDQSSNEGSFILERSVGDQAHFVAYDTLPPNTESTLDASISARKEYFYRIKAVNDEGQSDYSNVISASWIPGPAAPENLTVILHEPGTFLLEWNDNSSDELSFIVERSAGDSTHFTIFAALLTTSAFDSTIRGKEEYFYRVKAVNDEGASDYSNIASGRWIPGPAGDLTLSVTGYGETEFLLSWSGTATDHIGFIIEQSENGASAFVAKDTVSADVSSYIDAGSQDKIRFYRVGAYNESGVMYSNLVSALRDSEAARVPVFPVPAENSLFVQIPPDIPGGQWRLLSATGLIIPVSGELENDIIRFDIQTIPPGMYVAQYIVGDKTIQSTRVLVSR